ncbi:hypothetical protein [Deinococcus hopiensis]|uniref:hypothetical protein n=1 Tax=Deinococcus hopiensis TaxID=309885 RepID=UPI001FE86696|nr:hypothetical protein [Deinococcus hopiensis]
MLKALGAEVTSRAALTAEDAALVRHYACGQWGLVAGSGGGVPEGAVVASAPRDGGVQNLRGGVHRADRSGP